MDKPVTTIVIPPRQRARRAVFGLCVIGIGVLALLDNLHVFDFDLLRTFWPLVFVAFGLSRLVWRRHPGSAVFGLVLVAVGALMTARNLGYEPLDPQQWWPVFIILAGFAIVSGSALRGSSRRRRAGFESSALDHADEVHAEASFSGMKLRNDSRSFKGGRIAATFGGVELDLRDALMDGPEAVITIDASFGGVELRVPREWQVVVQMSATMGSVQDKSVPPLSPGHRLILRGEAIFGGVEIGN